MSKKRSKEWIKRSRAAKKGWTTRRKKKALEKEINKKTKLVKNAKKGVTKKVVRKLPKTPKIPKKKKRSVDELETLLRLKDEQIKILTLTKDWVHAMPPEFLHRDGTVALQPSRVRHLGKVTDEMLRMMKKAHRKGNAEFDRTVSFLAGHWNVPMREIYTLWYSP